MTTQALSLVLTNTRQKAETQTLNKNDFTSPPGIRIGRVETDRQQV
jgi:hypothetical protein